MSAALIVLLVITCFFWFVLLAQSLSQNASDAAGNAIARAYTAIVAGLVWILLAISLIVAGSHGQMPGAAQLLALVLMPYLAVAMQVTIKAMAGYRQLRWPAVLLILGPAMVIFYALWCDVPGLHRAIRPGLAGAITWGTIAALMPIPSLAKRHSRKIYQAAVAQYAAEAPAREAAQRKATEDAFHALTPDSDFLDWWQYTKPDGQFPQPKFDGAKTAKNRQERVPEFLKHYGSVLFMAMPKLNLTITPELEQGVRDFLRDQADRLMPYDPQRPVTTQVVIDWYARLLPVLKWFVANGGTCNAEIDAVVKAIEGYPETEERNRFVGQLKSLKK